MKPPPEEKLLRLIRGKTARAAAEAPGPQAAGAAAAMAGAAPGVPERARQFPWLKAAIGALSAVVCLELVVLLVQALWPLAPVTAPIAPIAATAPGTVLADGAAQGMARPPEMPSVAASASRPLFAAAAAPAAAAPSRPSGSATQLASRLTLMGIVAGDPAQAIIEDSQTQRTYFVTAGQTIVEGAVVEQVLENRVVLNLAGERIELTL